MRRALRTYVTCVFGLLIFLFPSSFLLLLCVCVTAARAAVSIIKNNAKFKRILYAKLRNDQNCSARAEKLKQTKEVDQKAEKKKKKRNKERTNANACWAPEPQLKRGAQKGKQLRAEPSRVRAQFALLSSVAACAALPPLPHLALRCDFFCSDRPSSSSPPSPLPSSFFSFRAFFALPLPA